MGWSTGAETALGTIDAASWDAGKQKDRFVAAVAIYPWCDGVGQFFSPALIIPGELDDITRASNCERLVKSVPLNLSVPVLGIMPGAYHWFDMLHPPVQTFDATYEYNAKATEATVNHVRSFLEGIF